MAEATRVAMAPDLFMSPQPAAQRQANRIIAKGSRSFSLASRILPRRARVDAWLVYAWCRHVDDAIDTSLAADRARRLDDLRRELDGIYTRGSPDPLWEALAEVIQRRCIPIDHFSTLLDGMQMDVDGYVYQTRDDLLLYCHRVAGVVGWLMVSVLGISDSRALRPAAHLGIAMQLTNICRDVKEDWDNQRLYLPNELLAKHGAIDLHLRLGAPFPHEHAHAVSAAVADLLAWADRFYATADEGMLALGARAALAVRTARLVYAAIGNRVRRTGCDVLRGRAVVPAHQKLGLLARAAAVTMLELPKRISAPHDELILDRVPRFPDDLLPM